MPSGRRLTRRYKLNPSERLIPLMLPHQDAVQVTRPNTLADFHVRLGNMTDEERKVYLRARQEKAALTRSANRFDNIQKRRAKNAGFDSVDEWQQWLRNIMSSGLVRLPKDHPLRAAGLVVDPLKYARVLLRSGLYKDEIARTRKFINKFDEPLKAEGFGRFKHSAGLPTTWDPLDPKSVKPKIGRPRKNGD